MLHRPQVRDWYVGSFSELRSFPAIKDAADEAAFTTVSPWSGCWGPPHLHPHPGSQGHAWQHLPSRAPLHACAVPPWRARWANVMACMVSNRAWSVRPAKCARRTQLPPPSALQPVSRSAWP